MTCKNAKHPSIPHDPYFTPEWLVAQACDIIIPRVLPRAPARMLEPGAGDGVWVRALRDRYPRGHITAIDINERFRWPEATESFYGDFLQHPRLHPGVVQQTRPYDLAIGNPPFSLAMPFLARALSISRYVCFLVRQGFLASSKRNSFFQRHRPSHCFVVAHRPCFIEGRSDSADYCFVCWGGKTSETILDWLPTLPREQRKSRSPNAA